MSISMSTEYPDPFAIPDRGFEKYEGPRDVEKFQPVDTQASDLRAFLQSAQPSPRPPSLVEVVTLPGGTVAQIITKSDNEYTLMIHLRRDFFAVFEGSSRVEVLRAAIRYEQTERLKA